MNTRGSLALKNWGLGLFFFKPLKQNHRHSTGGRKPAFWVDVDQQRDPEGYFWTTLLSNFHREMTSRKRHHRDKVSPCQAGSAMNQLHEKTLPISLPHVWPQQQQQSLLINYCINKLLPDPTAPKLNCITSCMDNKAVRLSIKCYSSTESCSMNCSFIPHQAIPRTSCNWSYA